MKIKPAAVFLACLLMLGGCGTVSSRSAPCHDGWTGSGPDDRSRAYRTTAEERESFKSFLPSDGRLICVHSMPSGVLILIWTSGHGIRTTELTPSGTGYVVTDQGAVV